MKEGGKREVGDKPARLGRKQRTKGMEAVYPCIGSCYYTSLVQYATTLNHQFSFPLPPSGRTTSGSWMLCKSLLFRRPRPRVSRHGSGRLKRNWWMSYRELWMPCRRCVCWGVGGCMCVCVCVCVGGVVMFDVCTYYW